MILPPLGASRSPSRLSRVLFPTPECPRIARISPGRMARSTPRRTGTEFWWMRYSLRRSRDSMRGWSVGSLIVDGPDGVLMRGPDGGDEARQEAEDYGGGGGGPQLAPPGGGGGGGPPS